MNATVVLVGRPNVGKSTLFNRLLGVQKSIVESTPGVTRDRIEGLCYWSGKNFTLCDTGGIIDDDKDVLNMEVLAQIEQAIKKANLILFVTDAKEGATQWDEGLARMLRKKQIKHKLLLLANKVDAEKSEMQVSDLYRLGLGDPIPISALHGRGIGDLLDEILKRLEHSVKIQAPSFLQMCMVGRPNVGKSSLFNLMLGESRAIVHDEAGTTRDSIDTTFTYQDKLFTLVDTAGLRKRSKATESIEFYSRTRTVKTITKSQVVLLVLEANEGVLAQDKKIVGEVEELGKALIILANKWDKLDAKSANKIKEFTAYIKRELKFVSYAPIIPTSVLTGEGIQKILPMVVQVYENWRQSLKSHDLKEVIQHATMLSPPPRIKGVKPKIKGVSQVRHSPPVLALRTNVSGELPKFYQHYLEGKLREAFPLEGTPIRMMLKKDERQERKR